MRQIATNTGSSTEVKARIEMMRPATLESTPALHNLPSNGCDSVVTPQSPIRKRVRQAQHPDLDDIESLVELWAELGANLPRAREELIRELPSFAVAEQHSRVTGCASLYSYDPQLAEIRSLGINPNHQGQGQGKAIVEYLLEQAEQLHIKKVFVLTRVPTFFQKLGFQITSRSLLPQKIMKDCERCPRQYHCDEVALELSFQP